MEHRHGQTTHRLMPQIHSPHISLQAVHQTSSLMKHGSMGWGTGQEIGTFQVYGLFCCSGVWCEHRMGTFWVWAARLSCDFSITMGWNLIGDANQQLNLRHILNFDVWWTNNIRFAASISVPWEPKPAEILGFETYLRFSDKTRGILTF